MDFLYRIPFTVLEVPNLKLKKPSFVKVSLYTPLSNPHIMMCISYLPQAPSAMVVFAMVLFSYFLVTGGIIYDVIVEPPSIG